MLFKSLLSAAMLATASASVSRGNTCGSEPPSAAQKAAARTMLENERSYKSLGMVREGEITVDTYVHIIGNNDDEDVDDEMWQAQLDKLNESFEPHGISFSLVEKTFNSNEMWANNEDTDTMKSELHQGDYGTLNMYFLPTLGDNLLGYCTLPVDGMAGSGSEWQDGCIMLSGTMPGGDAGDYSTGVTSVHEVGHWLGLLHTFEGEECDGEGDEVDDTPEQSEITHSCEEGQDTCPAEGLDPINNFMNYAPDECLFEFTEGQKERMHSMWEAYRMPEGGNTTLVQRRAPHQGHGFGTIRDVTPMKLHL